MFIKDGKRFNPNAPIVIDGVSYGDGQLLKFPEVMVSYGVTEIADPVAPEDFSDDLYYRTEQDDSPYVVYTRKSDEQIAAVRWGKIQALREDLKKNGGASVNGKWFHSDTDSKQQWERMANKAERLAMVDEALYLIDGQPVPWKTMDGTFVPLTAGLIRAVVEELERREAVIFKHAETLKANLAEDITQGWPARYVKESE